jgi:hypothetical protein
MLLVYICANFKAAKVVSHHQYLKRPFIEFERNHNAVWMVQLY